MVKKTQKKNGNILTVSIILTIIFSLVTIWYATDPLWPLITFAFALLTGVALKKHW